MGRLTFTVAAFLLVFGPNILQFVAPSEDAMVSHTEQIRRGEDWEFAEDVTGERMLLENSGAADDSPTSQFTAATAASKQGEE